jgi:hypothetical protein
MAANTVDLEKALLRGVVDCGLDMPIAQENAVFSKPKDGSPWAAAFVMYNLPRVVTLGEGGEDEHAGLLQIDLNFKLLTGRAETNAKVAQVLTFFRAGRALPYADTTAFVRSSGGPRSADVEGWYRTSITVEWYARIAR